MSFIYCTLHKILLGGQNKVNEMVGHTAFVWEMRHAYKFFFKKPDGKRPFWRSTHTWEDNLKCKLKNSV
jgi:hypothetical protein